MKINLDNLDNLGIGSGLLTIGLSVSELTTIVGLITGIFGLIITIFNLSSKIYKHLKKADKNGDGKTLIKEFIESLKEIDWKEAKTEIKEKVEEIKSHYQDLDKE